MQPQETMGGSSERQSETTEGSRLEAAADVQSETTERRFSQRNHATGGNHSRTWPDFRTVTDSGVGLPSWETDCPFFLGRNHVAVFLSGFE